MTLYDVLAVNISTGKVRVVATDKNERNAEAVVNMAVMRRGVETDYYVAVPREGEGMNLSVFCRDAIASEAPLKGWQSDGAWPQHDWCAEREAQYGVKPFVSWRNPVRCECRCHKVPHKPLWKMSPLQAVEFWKQMQQQEVKA